jgi:hypothetical protein
LLLNKENKRMTDTTTDDRLDTLIGAKAIADYANLDVRQAFHLLQLGELPATKMGKLWTSTKTAIRRRIEEGV